MPNYRVTVGFGMHIGWAIEGILGSPFKIDTSYLSTATTIVMFLEENTKTYGQMILISDHLWKLFSPEFQSVTRLLDNVIPVKNQPPLKLHTIDYDTSLLKPETDMFAKLPLV